MNANEVAPRIAELTALIEEKENDLAYKANRMRSISSRPGNNQAKRSFIARYRTEIKQLTDEINNLRTELWGLQELDLPGM